MARSMAVLGVILSLVAAQSVAAAKAPPLELVSSGLNGEAANGGSVLPKISDTGTVAWLSLASNLVADDLNGNAFNVFARPAGGVTQIVGANDPSTVQGSGMEDALGGISDDGRYVVFDSWVRLVPGDTNDLPDVYVRDLKTGALQWVSASRDGGSGDGWSFQGSISGDGGSVAFASAATNLVPGEQAPGETNVYVRDLRRGVTRRVAESAWTPDLDRLGHTVAFVHLGGTNHVYVLDLRTDVSQIASVDNAGQPGERGGSSPVLDADGGVVAFVTEDTLDPGDTVGPCESGTGCGNNVYLRDLRAGKTQQVDVSTAGAHADEISGGPSISDNGRRVAFVSLAHNLVPGDSNEAWDVFVRDLRRGTTERATVAANGEEADLQSLSSWLSPSGRLVAFSSQATNLLPADTNTTEDVFVRHLQP